MKRLLGAVVAGVIAAACAGTTATPIIVYVTPGPALTADPTTSDVATTAAPTPEATPAMAASPTFEGEGDRASDVMDLGAGEYRLDWKASGTCAFGVKIEAIGHDEIIVGSVLEVIDEVEAMDGSTIERLEGGRYALDVIGSGCAWAITLTPLS